MSTSTTPTPPASRWRVPPRPAGGVPGRVVAGAAGLDVAAVVVFVLLGQRSHAEGITVEGVADTAWPFVSGAIVGWGAGWVWRAPLSPRSGAVVWVSAVALGLALRAVDRGSVPLSFAVVTAVVLGLLLLGWRAVARALLVRGAR